MTQNVINTPLILLSGAFTMTGGSFNFIGRLTGDTDVTYPTSGTLLTTSTYPAPGATSGKIVISNGSSWIASTNIFPNTIGISQLLYASGANTITGLSTLASAVMLTDGSGVPGWLALSSFPYVPLAGGTMSGALILNTNSPSTALQAASKGYVDTQVATVAAGISVKDACVVATTANLSATYNNVAAGVGATLTNNSTQAALSIDGVALSLTNRVLVKNQSSAVQNGVYTVTVVGTVSTNWVLTRATDYDEPTEIEPGNLFAINEGTINAGTGWLQTATVTTIGTDPILFSPFAIVTAGTGLTKTGNQISLTVPVTVALGGTNATTASNARTNLGLAIGTDVQAYSAVLAAVAAGTYTGSSSITTLGTISTGTWAADAITVPFGGSGRATATAYAVICGGTTATGAHQSVASVGSPGQALISNGPGMLPTFQNQAAGSGFVCQGRLTLTSGVAVTTADTINTTIYFTPYRGNLIDLYTGSGWARYTFSELSFPIPANTDTVQDVFVFDNAGTLTIFLHSWTNDTTRADPLVLRDGVYVYSLNETYRYVGTIRTWSVLSQVPDTNAYRYVYNYYNRVEKTMNRAANAGNWNYSTATIRAANNSQDNRVWYLQGIEEEPVSLSVRTAAVTTSNLGPIQFGVGVDSTTTFASLVLTNLSTTNNAVPLICFYSGYPGVGAHFLSWNEEGTGVGTQTWYGGDVGSFSMSGYVYV